jgi:hypothetical protein
VGCRRGDGKSDGIFAEDYGSCDESAYRQAGKDKVERFLREIGVLRSR